MINTVAQLTTYRPSKPQFEAPEFTESSSIVFKLCGIEPLRDQRVTEDHL